MTPVGTASALARFAAARILLAIPTLFGLATIVFFLSRLFPGDPATLHLAPSVPPAVAESIRTQFGLDRPLAEQYFSWLWAVLRGDFGFSFSHHVGVREVLVRTFPNTLLLGLATLAVEIAIAIALVYVAFIRPGKPVERLLMNGTLVVYALPSFWIGILLIATFAYGLGLLPSSQMYTSASAERSIGDLLQHLILPATAIALPGAAALARYLQSGSTSLLHSDHLVAARSMGLSEGRIFRSYVLPNAAASFVGAIGVEIGVLFAGVVTTEVLFSWPGMGRLTVSAILARDYPLILGCTLLAGAVVVVGNLVADLIAAFIDPRIRTRS